MHLSVQSVAAIALLTSYCHAQNGYGVILTGPQTQVVAPWELVTFNCHARGESVYWYVNGSDPYPRENYEARGFDFSYNETNYPQGSNQLDEHNNTIIIEARPSNNNTRIACTASGWVYGQHAFQEGTLIIAGPPLRPSIVNLSQEHVLDSSNFTYHLIWSAPFTWQGFPIISYKVTVFSHLDNGSTTTIMHINDSHSASLSHDGTSSGESCYGLTFYVAASNSLGEGEHTMIQSGHHIVPGEIGDIETTITFLSNGTPHLWMSFLAPRICPGYQIGTHNIIIYDDNGSPVHIFEPKDYTQVSEGEARLLVVKEMKNGLNFGENYVIEVTASSMGIERSKTKHFDTFLDTHLVCTPEEPGALSNSLNDCSQSAMNLELIVGISIGGISVITFGCFCLFMVLCLTCRRMKSNRKLSSMPVIETDSALNVKQKKPKSGRPPNLTLQAKNPIYEGGAMYEVTPGESLKSLLSPCSIPCTPMADAASRYTFDFPPKLPPPRKGSVSIPPKLETHEEVKDLFKQAELPPLHQNGDEYMIMNAGESDNLKKNGTSESTGNSNNFTYSTVVKLGNEDEYVTLN